MPKKKQPEGWFEGILKQIVGEEKQINGKRKGKRQTITFYEGREWAKKRKEPFGWAIYDEYEE